LKNEIENTVAISEESKKEMQLGNIFTPYAANERRKLYEPNAYQSAKFVHYTSAEAALSIINSRQIWLRNTTCMSDYREVQHGFSMLQKFFDNKSNLDDFTSALEVCAPGVAKEGIDLFNAWWSDTQSQTFIASVSVHDDKTEDEHGRLSMWHAFGGNNPRVALVFNVPWASEATSALSLMFSPVAYFGENEVYAEIRNVIQNIRGNSAFLNSVDRTRILAHVFNMLVAGAVCLKHEGFREEREWRIIYAPNRRPSSLMKFNTEIIGGVPQIIYKAPLDGTAGAMDLPNMFDRLIIGPSQYYLAMYQAFADALSKAGVSEEEVKKRIVFSGITIRS